MEAAAAIGRDIQNSKVIEALSVGVAWTFDDHVGTNARLRQMLRLANDDISLGSFLESFELRTRVGEAIQLDETPFRKALQGHFTSDRMLLISRDGKPIDALVTAIPIELVGGEQEPLVLYQEVPLREEERGALSWLSAIEHELRGTLQALSLAVTIALKPGTVLNAQQGEMLQRNLTLLSRLIEDLIDAVSINHRTVLFRPTRIYLADMVRRLVEMASQTDSRHSFQWSAPPEIVAFADPDRLQQIVINLLTNAFKYSTPGMLELGVRSDSDRVLLWIKDQGPGISEKDQTILFHPYSRLPSRERGSGLGLWIARELARGMGGDVWLISGLGEHTTFYVALPALSTAGKTSWTTPSQSQCL